MANIKSAKKRVKVIKAKTLKNKMLKTNMKTTLKKANVALAANAENKTEATVYAMKRVDQMAAKGIIHKNKAARLKSQLAKKLNAAQ